MVVVVENKCYTCGRNQHLIIFFTTHIPNVGPLTPASGISCGHLKHDGCVKTQFILIKLFSFNTLFGQRITVLFSAIVFMFC